METVSFAAMGTPVKGYLQDDYPTLAAHKVRPALVICPGGAYRWLSPREKDPPAFEFLAMGYQVFILEYSCGEQAGAAAPCGSWPRPCARSADGTKNGTLTPTRSPCWASPPGGHLAASLGALWNDEELALPKDARPDALVLCCPVISTKAFAHQESAEWVTGGDEVCCAWLPLCKTWLNIPFTLRVDGYAYWQFH